MTKLIFMDIDGVLNNLRYRPRESDGPAGMLDPRNVALLNELVIRTGAEVVVTSSWRRTRTQKDIEGILSGAGFLGAIKGLAPDLSAGVHGRWKEIQTVLQKRNVPTGKSGYVILDDEWNMGPLAHNHVRTSRLAGLSSGQLPQAIACLGGEQTDPIHFFHPREKPFGFLSNFSPHPIDIVKTWPTVEHYYQAMKFADESLQDEIRAAANPGVAKHLTRRHKSEMRPDWEEIKDGVMCDAMKAKFHFPLLRAALAATGDRLLVENSSYDGYWGVGSECKGQNRLGKMLMELRRDCLRRENTF